MKQSLSRSLSPDSQWAGLWTFFALSGLHMLTVTWAFYRSGNPASGADWITVFHLAVWVTYSALYLLPALAFTGLVALLARALPRLSAWVVPAAIFATSACILLIRGDSVVYDLYNFHFNGFVLNLLLTPGGVQSLGGGSDTYGSIAVIAAGHAAIQVIAWYGSRWLAAQRPIIWHRGWLFAVFAVLMLGERLAYGVADLHNEGRILDAVKTYPFYGRTKIRSLATKFGIEPHKRPQQLAVASSQGRLNYPAGAVNFAPVEHPPNVVILVAESLRWDRLTETIMPNTWQLAGRSQHFTRHYSSGNGTREALFGLFYGLYGSYWSSFLYAQRSPLLMDRFQQLGYQFDLRTSAKFTYPEFDRTLFAGMPADQLHEAGSGKTAWEVDRDNTDALIDFLKRRDPARPFMSFFFIESTHARYTFPEEAVIARPYLENVNYAAMSRESLTPQISQLLNRYTNAAHWVDKQVGRIVAELERQKLLDNTIVIVTGDHGEEFMEKGFWGHNSSFVDEQVRTPMVMWVPGQGHRQIDRLTSHLDIGTTLLQMLGAPADTRTYSLGRNLFDATDPAYIVSSDWHSIAVISPEMKYRIPYTNRGVDQWSPTDPADRPLPPDEGARMIEKHNPWIFEAIRNCSRFLASGKPA